MTGSSPMPPRPPSQQDGPPNSQRMSQSPMSASGKYNVLTCSQLIYNEIIRKQLFIKVQDLHTCLKALFY